MISLTTLIKFWFLIHSAPRKQQYLFIYLLLFLHKIQRKIGKRSTQWYWIRVKHSLWMLSTWNIFESAFEFHVRLVYSAPRNHCGFQNAVIFHCNSVINMSVPSIVAFGNALFTGNSIKTINAYCFGVLIFLRHWLWGKNIFPITCVRPFFFFDYLNIFITSFW